MKLIKSIRSLALGAAVLCSSVANATVIEFSDFGTSFTNFTFRTIEDILPGVDLTIEAALFSEMPVSGNEFAITDVDTGSGDLRRVGFIDEDGLGVRGINTDLGGRIDGGNDANDLVILTFSAPVFLTSIGFSDFGNSDDFEFGLVDGDTFINLLSQEDVVDEFSFSGLSGTVFGIGALGNNDSFRLSSITAFVPAPAALGFLALAMVLVGARKRLR